MKKRLTCLEFFECEFQLKNIIDFEKRFNVKIIEGYGSTEMGMPLWKSPEDSRVGSCGYQVEGYYLEIRNPEKINEVIAKINLG